MTIPAEGGARDHPVCGHYYPFADISLTLAEKKMQMTISAERTLKTTQIADILKAESRVKDEELFKRSNGATTDGDAPNGAKNVPPTGAQNLAPNGSGSGADDVAAAEAR
jgi:hypothetical protein